MAAFLSASVVNSRKGLVVDIDGTGFREFSVHPLPIRPVSVIFIGSPRCVAMGRRTVTKVKEASVSWNFLRFLQGKCGLAPARRTRRVCT